MGQTGDVTYPEYVADTYTEFMAGNPVSNSEAVNPGYIPVVMNTNVSAEVNTLVGTNPYLLANQSTTTVQATNPDTLLADYEARIGTFIAKIEELDAEGLWTDYANTAGGMVDSLLADTADEDADVAQFEDTSAHNLAESLNRINAGLFDINGVVGTTLPNGQALLEAKYNTDIARYRSERRMTRNRERAALIIQSINEMSKMFALRLNAEGNAVNAKNEFLRIKLTTKDNQTRQNLDYTIHEDMWSLDTLIRGGSMINAMAGITPVPERLTSGQQLLANAFGATGFGIQLGTATGSMGLGVLGGFGGFLLAEGARNGSFG